MHPYFTYQILARLNMETFSQRKAALRAGSQVDCAGEEMGEVCCHEDVHGKAIVSQRGRFSIKTTISDRQI